MQFPDWRRYAPLFGEADHPVGARPSKRIIIKSVSSAHASHEIAHVDKKKIFVPDDTACEVNEQIHSIENCNRYVMEER
jgi:hypothetical protein